MDAVVLANYATEHAPYAIRCLDAGKHVLSEVLPCETMAQAVELIEAVERSGKVYAYAENYCYMQSTFEMWHKYEAGLIGEVEYCEGEYIHDCSRCWPSITYGDREHWRNQLHANFYCTHSIGPLLTVTGRRPVQVVGFETPPRKSLAQLGSFRGTGVELITLDNGAVARSVHGDLKREPCSINYQFYGSKGMMESGRLEENKVMNLYEESDKLCIGSSEQIAIPSLPSKRNWLPVSMDTAGAIFIRLTSLLKRFWAIRSQKNIRLMYIPRWIWGFAVYWPTVRRSTVMRRCVCLI